MSLTVVYIYKSPKIYRATLTLEIAPKAANILGRGMEIVSVGSSGYYWANKEYYKTQYEIIKSRAVSLKVAHSLSKENLLSLLDIDISKLPKKQREQLDPVAVLQSRISVTPKKNSNIVKISVDGKNPENVAFLTNSLAAAYIDFNLEKKYITTKDAAKWLGEQSLNLKKQLENSEFTLFDFKKNHAILSSTFKEKQKILSDKIMTLNHQLTKKEIALKLLQSKISAFENLDYKNPEAFFSIENSEKNGVLKDLKLNYLQLISKIKEKQKIYGEKYPELISLKASLESLKHSLIIEIQGILKKLKLKETIAINEIKKLKKMLIVAQKNSVNLNKLEIRYSKLKRDIDTNKKLYNIVLERTKEADLSALLKSNNIRIIDKALTPKIPVKPRKKLLLLIGFMLSLFFGFFVVFLLEFFDTKFRSMEELENTIGITALGVLPTFIVPEDKKIREIAFEESKHSPAIEALRSIRTNIRLSNPDVDLKALLITSSESQEGKTTVSSNVATSFAISGKKVILVDTDMRKPRIHKLFKINNNFGISTVMLGEKKLEEVINKNVYSSLDVLTCGPIPPNPAEMIESVKFKEMVDELKLKYDLVVFDSPPIIPVSDALSLATMTEGVILTVKIKKITRDILKRAVSQFKNSNSVILGTIINNVDLKNGTRYGSYYYYYYHHKYYGEEEKK